jgi:hypothetical protein
MEETKKWMSTLISPSGVRDSVECSEHEEAKRWLGQASVTDGTMFLTLNSTLYAAPVP